MSEALSLLFNLSVLIFVYASMFGLGLNVTVSQIVQPLRNWSLVAFSLLANFVISPILAFVIAPILGLDENLAIGFFIVSVCAGAPVMAKHAELAKGDLPFTTALMVLLQVGTVVAAALLLPLMLAASADNIEIDSLGIIQSLVVNMLLPLALGLFVYARYESLADTLRPYASQAATITLMMQIVLGLVLGFRELLGLVGTRAFLASALLVVASLVVGYLLGGARRETKVVLAIGTATANISAAMLITIQNFAEPQTIIMVLSFGLVSLIINTVVAGEFGKRAGDEVDSAPPPDDPASVAVASHQNTDTHTQPRSQIMTSQVANADITVFSAKKIVTMNPSNPEGTHVAVRDGRILGVGSLEEVAGWGDYTLDETFNDKVLLPGFVEAHSHPLEGLMALFPYVGYFDRSLPDGTVAPAIKSYAALIDRLKELDAEMDSPDDWLIVQGFDPIYFTEEERLGAEHLDQVSTTRPIFILHASGHLGTVNTVGLQRYNVTAETEVEGVGMDANGQPNGELQEFPAMGLMEEPFHTIIGSMGKAETIWNFGYAMRNAGITTATDMGGTIVTNPASEAVWREIVNDDAFPMRVAIYNLPTLPGGDSDYGQLATQLKELQATSTDKLRFSGVKFVLDGSNQGYTGVFNWPGYYKGEDHGLLLVVPEQFPEMLLPFHKAGLNVHMHCNGDKTVDLAVDAVEEVLREVAWLNHRHTIQHSQFTTAAQYRKMANLGLCANIFTNHIWFWGDQHYELTMGPERANRMEACATAKREGVHFSMHSDASVTPPGHLHTMWCAVNRVTPKGRVVGEQEKISAYDALYACTVDAAYQLHMDHEIGTIEVGKWADFAVLDESPLDVDPMAIKEIPMWGTVVGGVKYQSTKQAA